MNMAAFVFPSAHLADVSRYEADICNVRACYYSTMVMMLTSPV